MLGIYSNGYIVTGPTRIFIY